MIHSYPIYLEIAGPTAMWTRPDTGDSPVSYPVPTSSAAEGIFKSILWGPAVEIHPVKVEICAPIIYHSYAQNYGGVRREAKAQRRGTNYQMYATVLINVCYRLYAKVSPYRNMTELPEKARQWDKHTTAPGHAYQAIFERRLKRGQCYSIPCLGLREFTPSYFGPFRSETHVCEDLPDIHIPSMLRQVFPLGYQSDVSYVYDTDLVIQKGVLTYPQRGDGL